MRNQNPTDSGEKQASFYIVCPHCSAKFFHDRPIEHCPRCNLTTLQSVRATPPWLVDRDSPPEDLDR